MAGGVGIHPIPPARAFPVPPNLEEREARTEYHGTPRRFNARGPRRNNFGIRFCPVARLLSRTAMKTLTAAFLLLLLPAVAAADADKPLLLQNPTLSRTDV